jgi:predicted GH43/DUF377 family glycosyl hydrolase
MIPTPLRLSEDIVRIYLGHLDRNSVGRIGYVDVAMADPLRPLAIADKPVLDIGDPGTFDDNGAVPSCVIPIGGALRMYYSGFQLQTKIPYTIFSGLAASESTDDDFRRSREAPILDRTEGELFFRASPLVLRDGGRWRMWYFGGSDWIQTQRKALPCYSLRHIESDDGISWSGRSTECLVPKAPEIGFGRPFVLRDGSLYRMWYSIRSPQGYRLGYATSPDGLQWTREDDSVGIKPSQTGWDSEMICYAAVVPTAAHWLMFYNGNNYGRTGVGVAVAPR